MRRILVTAISGNVSNGILKILQETQDEVYGCDIYDYPVGMDKVIDYWKSDLAVSSCYIDNLLMKCKEYKITHLIPVNEIEICVINKNIQKFQQEGIKVMINRPELVEIFLDKYKTYQYLKKIGGVHVPVTYRYSDYVEDGNEYIVKFNNSCGSKFLEIVKTKSQIDKFHLKEEEYIIQQYLRDAAEEYTVGVFSDGNKTAVIVFKRKLEHGYTSFVELVHDKTIEKVAVAIAKEIGLRGYINIQLRKQNNENYIFEVNPRISGTVCFRHMLGFKDVLWWLELLDGRSNFEYVCKYKKAVGMRELCEKFVELDYK